jgi:hypothetical protein
VKERNNMLQMVNSLESMTSSLESSESPLNLIEESAAANENADLINPSIKKEESKLVKPSSISL